MVNIGFTTAHKLLGYFLLPVRLVATLPFLLLALVSIYLHSFGILPKKFTYLTARLWARASNIIFGINIHIKKDKEYKKYQEMSKDEKFIFVYNHINPLDPIWVLPDILDNYISFVAIGKIINRFPISYICKFLKTINIDKSHKSNTTQKINDFLQNTKHKLCIAPDQCAHFNKEEYIAPFKTGAFANKNNVLPIVIRYVPSYRSDDFNWNNPKNKDIDSITYMKKILLDGNIDVHIKFLDLQKYDEKKYSDCKEYAEDVREKMKLELKKLPKQEESNLDKVKVTNVNCIFFITLISLIISILALFLKDFEIAFHMMTVAFSGFLFHSFPTNSTLLFDRIFVFYGIVKLILYKNTNIINLVKYCILFYAIARNLRNNLQDKVPGANSERDNIFWLTRHLYDVQFPVLFISLIVLLDRNLIIK